MIPRPQFLRRIRQALEAQPVHRYPLAERVEAVPFAQAASGMKGLFPPKKGG